MLFRSHNVADALISALADHGLSVARADNVYHMTVLFAASPAGQYRAALVAVDYFNRYELDFFRLAGRASPGPAIHTVALAEAGFADKAALACAAGAWAMAAGTNQAAEVAATLAHALADEPVEANVNAPTTSPPAEIPVSTPSQKPASPPTPPTPATPSAPATPPAPATSSAAISMPLSADDLDHLLSDAEPATRELLRFTPPARRPPERPATAPLPQRQPPPAPSPAPTPPMLREPEHREPVQQTAPQAARPPGSEYHRAEDLLTPEEIAALLNGWEDDDDGPVGRRSP